MDRCHSATHHSATDAPINFRAGWSNFEVKFDGSVGWAGGDTAGFLRYARDPIVVAEAVTTGQSLKPCRRSLMPGPYARALCQSLMSEPYILSSLQKQLLQVATTAQCLMNALWQCERDRPRTNGCLISYGLYSHGLCSYGLYGLLLRWRSLLRLRPRQQTQRNTDLTAIRPRNTAVDSSSGKQRCACL